MGFFTVITLNVFRYGLKNALPDNGRQTRSYDFTRFYKLF